MSYSSYHHLESASYMPVCNWISDHWMFYDISGEESRYSHFLLVLYFLTLAMLWTNSADDKLMIFFLFSLGNMFWHFMQIVWGWSGVAKVSCILLHRSVQLILGYSKAKPAILVAGKGRRGMFLFLLFLHFHSHSSFFPFPLCHLLYCLFYLFSPFLWEMTQNDPQGLTCIKPQHNHFHANCLLCFQETISKCCLLKFYPACIASSIIAFFRRVQ